MKSRKTQTRKRKHPIKEKGITLIALVITIVILLILAGLTINLALGDGGLAQKAKEATENYQLAQEAEEDLIQELEANMNPTEEGYNSQEGVNEPVLTEGMIPVTWNGSSWVKADASTGDWYEYKATGEITDKVIYKQWANVVTVKESGTKTRAEYMSAAVGTAIPEDDIVGMYVWIPRYSYRITSGYHENANGTGNVDIKFLKGTTDNYEGGEAIRSNVTNGEEFVVHPSFTKDTSQGGMKETTGYWVAKFEASSNIAVKNNANISNTSETNVKYGGGNNPDLEVTVRPNVTSWRYITAENIFKVCRNITKDGNIQGLTNKVDPHMMKNSEWGAVAYLTQSSYGNKQGTDSSSGVWNNAYNECLVSKGTDNGSNYGGIGSYGVTLTGAVGESRNAYTSYYSEQTSITDKNADSITISYTEYAQNGTTTAKTQTYYKYYTTNGIKGSTTGNIYGIYDMSGGSWEYMADYLANGTTSVVTYFKENVSNRYKTEYKGDGATDSTEDKTANYNANSDRYGDALWETSNGANGQYSWNQDYSGFPYLSGPFFIRGCHFNGGGGAGLFYFHGAYGGADNVSGFRPVLGV